MKTMKTILPRESGSRHSNSLCSVPGRVQIHNFAMKAAFTFMEAAWALSSSRGTTPAPPQWLDSVTNLLHYRNTLVVTKTNKNQNGIKIKSKILSH